MDLRLPIILNSSSIVLEGSSPIVILIWALVTGHSKVAERASDGETWPQLRQARARRRRRASFQQRALNVPAAQHFVSAVEDDRLTRVTARWDSRNRTSAQLS